MAGGVGGVGRGKVRVGKGGGPQVFGTNKLGSLGSKKKKLLKDHRSKGHGL